MRILLIHPSANINGAGRIVALLAKYLKRRGHDTQVILPESGPLCRAHADDFGVPVFVPMTVIRRRVGAVVRHILEFPSTVGAMKRVIAAWKPDLVHVNCLYNLWGGTAARLMGVPIVYHIHEAPGSFPGWLYGLWQGAVSQLANRVVVVNHDLTQALPSCAKKVAVIENGVDIERLQPAPSSGEWRSRVAAPRQKLILCPSHFMPQKNQLLLVAAAPMILESLENVVIVFLGDTNGVSANEAYLRQIQALSASLGCSQRIAFTSEPHDALAAYCAADLIVYPSKYESFGLVPLEALAAGRPVVTVRTGVAQRLQAQGCAVRTVSGDSPHELARAVINLFKSPPPEQSLKLPAELTGERVAEQFEKLYKDILEEK
jgi:glycosyltransferase involved in cell wall biosynthesis